MVSPHSLRIADPPHSADLVVIGGGVIGAATAYFASRAGLSVVVIEKRPQLGALTTSAATGAFREQFDNPDEMALVREGIALYSRFGEISGLGAWDLGLHRQGYLWLATREETAARQRELVSRQRAWGLGDVELLGGDEARRRFPYLAPEVIQARWRAADGWLDPRRLTMGYARASGASFALRTEALGLERGGGRVRGVSTSRGIVSAGNVVIAAGPLSARAGAWAGLDLPLSFVRRQRLVLPDVPAVPATAPMTIDEETGAHWRPALGGAHVLFTQPHVQPGPPLDEVPASEADAFRVLDPASPDSIARISPFWREVWERGDLHWFARAGQYDYTPDHRPILGPTEVDGLFINAGYSGHGIMCSAGGSRLVVDTLLGRIAPEANPFRPDRPFAERALDVL